MTTLDELAREYMAMEKIDNGYPFQRRARILQAIWRQEAHLQIHIDTYGIHRGSCIDVESAKQSLANFLTDEIKQVVCEEVLGPKSQGKLYGQPRIFNNLLSSQPMVFNLFAMLSRNLALATKIFAQMSQGRCQEITRMEFEYSPGRRDKEYLGDRSAFDVYVEYIGRTGLGFMGIEVKYHENMNTEDRKKEGVDPNPRYDEVTELAECFIKAKLANLKAKPLQQIWRDHLLAASILQKDKEKFRDGFFVFLSPKDNVACRDAVVGYRNCLSCSKTFVHWTLEQMVATIRKFTSAPWVTAFHDRYLNFTKIDQLLA